MEKQKFLILISIFILVLLIVSSYSNTFHSPPVLDDLHSFVEEPRVQITSLSFASIKNLSQTKFGLARLLPMASFAWDYYWGKGAISAFHVTNLGIHIACCLTLFYFMVILFTCSRFNFSEWFITNFEIYWLAFIITGLWSLSPLQTNAVTYLVQRMTSMSALFYLVSISTYLHGRLASKQQKKKWFSMILYSLSVFAALGAFLSKQNSATLPIVIIMVESFFFTPDLWKRFFHHRILVIICTILLFILLFWFFHHFLPKLLHTYDHNRRFNMEQRLLTELRVVSSYIVVLLLPLPQYLSLEHDVLLSTSLFSPLSTLFSLLFLGTLLLLAWKVRKKYCLIAFGVWWFFINLLIESSILPLELKFEHRLYLPSVGIFLALVVSLYVFIKQNVLKKHFEFSPKLAISISFIVLSLLSSMTYIRNNCWHTRISIYEDCVKKAPKKSRTHSNLSQAYAQNENYNKAIEEAELSIAIEKENYEEYWVASSNIVSSYVSLGMLQKAVDRGEDLLENAPQNLKQNAYPTFLKNLGTAYVFLEEYSLAYKSYLEAFDFLMKCDELPYLSVIESNIISLVKVVCEKQDVLVMNLGLDVTDPSVPHGHMSRLYFDRGQYMRALDLCELGLVENPNSSQCIELKNEINSVLTANLLQEEKGTLKEKYFYNPFQSRFHLLMAASYVMEKSNLPDNPLLSYCLRQAEELNPTSADLILLKSWRYYQQGNYETALTLIDRGIELDPDYAHSWINRGIYALAVGQRQVALLSFKKSLSLYPGYPYRDKVVAMIDAAEKLGKQETYSSVNHRQSGGNNG